MTSKEWKKCKLGDIADVTKLAGFEFTKYINYDESGEIIALRALNLRNGILDLSDIKRIKKSVSDSLTRSKLYINDILLTYTGNGYGDCAIIKENDKYHLAPNICKISPKIEIVDPYYLYSYIRSKQFYTQMTNNMVGSGQPTIPMKTIRILEIPISSKNKQQKIAKVLSAIDDKIELNNLINNNLEQQAQAIFKSWFVDFEPFAGTMPNDWKDETLGVISNITSGKRPIKKSQQNNKEMNIPIIGASSIMGYTNDVLFDEKILVTGRVGTHGIVQKISFPCWPSDNTLVITSPCYEYVYQILKTIDYSKLNRGSTQPLITQSDLKNIKVLLPSRDILSKFESVAFSFSNLQNQLREENRQLAQLRDTILPKLMNGEIDVSKVEISADKLYEPANESKLSAEPYNSSGSFASASKNLPSEQSSSTDKLLFIDEVINDKL